MTQMTDKTRPPVALPLPLFRLTAVLCAAIGGLALSRILFEATFPNFLWLGRPLSVLLLVTVSAILGGRYAVWLVTDLPSTGKTQTAPVAAHFLILLPLLLNLLYLFDPTVDLIRSRFLFAASLWLVAVASVHRRSGWRPRVRVDLLFILIALLPVYWLTMPHAVGRADTFEFQVVAPQLGIAHPTGYPLYLLLGKLFTLLPAGTVAWRLNLASAVYGLAACGLLYLVGRRLLHWPLPALLGVVALGLTPIFWSQAIEAEVYTLHALIVAGALYLMVRLLAAPEPGRLFLILAFLLGLGVTNHLTTLFLLPPAGLALLFAWKRLRVQDDFSPFFFLKASLAFGLPLLLYAYLPIRWMAVNGEAMGTARFLDWVVGGRFQGALQWGAWLSDPTRYAILGRLLLDNWGGFNLLLALAGLIFLLVRPPTRRAALILLLVGGGYSFYALNYYVPDLAVFLIPAHLVLALGWAAGLMAVIHLAARLAPLTGRPPMNHPLAPVLVTLFVLPPLLAGVTSWNGVDRSGADGLMRWGEAVLEMPLADGAAILADSEKIAPLYYLQQAEGIRRDLSILVLPDEAAYRAELHARMAAGQNVYLARFVPGLEGSYHLRSVGPLTEVAAGPLTTLPAGTIESGLTFGPVELLGYRLAPDSPFEAGAAAVTLYWRAGETLEQNLAVYIRWEGDAPGTATGQHPANNYYPTVAWAPGEIVSDFHQLPRPVGDQPVARQLQVALAPLFTPPTELAWQTVTTVTLPPAPLPSSARPLRAQIGPLTLTGIAYPGQIRPQEMIPVVLSGTGDPAGELNLTLGTGPISAETISYPGRPGERPFTVSRTLSGPADTGPAAVVARYPGASSICGWLAAPSPGCRLGSVAVSGVPLPDGAINFADQIALLALSIPDPTLVPGGELAVNLRWQALSAISQDYTVFVQVLDEQDRLVGQVDSWPVQGTRPTSSWTPGEIVADPYRVRLNPELPSGSYRLQVGFYLLATLQRLPVLDEDGRPVDDKLLVPGLVVEP